MVERQDPARIKRRFQRLRIRLAGDIFEQLIDAVAPLQHRIVFFARADEVREGELFAGQMKLEGMSEGHLERVVLAPRAAFEQKLSLLADDQQLGGFARPAGEFDDGVDDADVEMRKDDGQFLGRELLAKPGNSVLPRAGS